MKTKLIFVLGLLLIAAGTLFAQEKTIGVFGRYLPTNTKAERIYDSYSENAFSLGVFTAYHPKKAVFSISYGVQYISTKEQILAVPLNLYFLLDKTMTLKIGGGLLPFFRLKPALPDKTFGIGEHLGLGIQAKILQKYYLFTDFGLIGFPVSNYVYSHSGTKELEHNHYWSAYLNFGIKYILRSNL